ncbi:hypothetical protein H5410_023016 [Solanum commersonii]|uniref:Uncharacterized protein n=1 Tax=Solanum commersonii TaxID=4109 RepID=A0A9J5ZIA6_SOLCO|nr:hypothetical protein H5410_023016 [Solanum commersonii]
MILDRSNINREGYKNDFARVVSLVEGRENVLRLKPDFYDLKYVHNKAQITHARISCIFKDSSCDTPLSNILKLTMLALNTSSSSTKEIKCPHTKE